MSPDEPYGTFTRKEPIGEYVRDDGTILDPLLAQAMNDMMKDFQASKQHANEPIRIIGLATQPEVFQPNNQCDTQVDPGDDEDDWHISRICEFCGKQWWGLHCQCDGRQNPCPHCDKLPTPRPCPKDEEDGE